MRQKLGAGVMVNYDEHSDIVDVKTESNVKELLTFTILLNLFQA
jgi:hypothetical protein